MSYGYFLGYRYDEAEIEKMELQNSVYFCKPTNYHLPL